MCRKSCVRRALLSSIDSIRFPRLIVILGAASAGPLLFAAPARAAATATKQKPACAVALERARESEQGGHLRRARDQLAGCAKVACGAALLQECTSRYTRLDLDDIPSIVPVVTDESGARRVDVQVEMDGEVLASRLDAQPIQVDPGVHEFSFATTSGARGTATLKTLIVEGQRGRLLSVALHGGAGHAGNAAPGRAEDGAPAPAEPGEAPAKPPPARDGAGAAPESPASPAEPHDNTTAPPTSAEESHHPAHGPVAPYVLAAFGGAVIAGGGAGALLWASWGKKDGLFLASDLTVGVSIGAGVTALGFAVWRVLSARPSDTTDKPSPSSARYHVDVAPARAGAVASFSGAF